MTAAIVPYPKAKKRGRKSTKGPAATVLSFPAPLTGDALYSRWAWLLHHHRQWMHEDVVGNWDDEPEQWKSYQGMAPGYARMAGQTFSESWMRSDIKRMECKIQKRTEMKDWLDTLDIDWDHIRTAEDGLVFLFDRFHRVGPPPAA